MQDLNDKLTGGSLSAAEWNEVPSEIQNIIEAAGITLSGGDLNQMGKSIASYVANGSFYTDSGIADAYVLSVVGLIQSLPAYVNGMQIRFRAGNTNTGVSTINVAGLGVKTLKTVTGVDLPAGYIRTDVNTVATYDGTNFVLNDQGDLYSIGVNQSWQNLTASRAAAVTYTNTTGKPLGVSINTINVVTGDFVRSSIIVDGLTVAVQSADSEGSNTNIANTSAIVPDGSTYSLTIAVGVLSSWFELR